jgi:hypothetical protein
MQKKKFAISHRQSALTSMPYICRHQGFHICVATRLAPEYETLRKP